jgi:hypothetical protein
LQVELARAYFCFSLDHALHTARIFARCVGAF